MPEYQFKAGDYVTKFSQSSAWGFSYGPVTITKVKRALARFVELEDGSKWDYFGDEYPKSKRSSGYHRPEIRPMLEEHRVTIKSKNLRAKIETWTREGKKGMELANLDELEAVYAIIKKSEARIAAEQQKEDEDVAVQHAPRS